MSYIPYFDEDARDAIGAALQGGNNITVSEDDPNDQITIDTTALSEEEVEDAVNALLTAGTSIDLTYDDTNDTLTIGVIESNIFLSELGSLDAGSQKITSVSDPTNAQDAATKSYADGVASGLDIKESVRAATDGTSFDLSTGSDGSTVDGVSVSSGDRVLLKDQTDSSENGIYVVDTPSDTSTWTRASDFDEDSEVTAGAFTFVEEGTANADDGFVVTTDDSITVGTTDIIFSQFSGAGSIVAGDGLSKSGDTLNVNVDGTTIEVSSDQLQVVAGGITSNEIDETDNYSWTGTHQFGGQTDLNGILTKDIQSVSSNTTLTGDVHTTLADASGGAITITLPSSPVDGELLTVKKIDSSSNAVTIDGNGNNIDGSTSQDINKQYNSLTVQFRSADSTWYIV